jgi:predicted PhzF superfamily epimerase YddE/YHI9
MRVPIYQVDAFTSRRFAGNPAAVCPLESWLPDATLQAIAAENNLAETAFVTPQGEGYALRWFTPKVEVNLCGHATLATAFVLLRVLGRREETLRFETRSGRLTVTTAADALTLDFPVLPPIPTTPPAWLPAALGGEPQGFWRATDYLVLYPDEAAIRALQPDLRALAAVEARGVIVTAPGEESDFVSRFFAPGAGIDEDPVTGSAHCTLTPFWSERLGKDPLLARQVSSRGGELHCRLVDDRVLITGEAVLYLEGQIYVDEG